MNSCSMRGRVARAISPQTSVSTGTSRQPSTASPWSLTAVLEGRAAGRARSLVLAQEDLADGQTPGFPAPNTRRPARA
jgi:hypothetical protein